MLFKKIILALFAFSVVSSSFAGVPGYVTDKEGNLVHDKEGRCVRTGTWTKDNLIPECDPNAVKKAQTPDNGNSHAVGSPQFKAEVKPLAEPPAATAEPLPAPVPAPLVLKKAETLNLDASVMFDFDKSTLTKEGKTTLDSVVEALKKAEYKTINLDGYTDRIGTDKYNLKLSQKRADAVKAYLVAHGVDATKIKATGHGKSKFRTTTTDCKGLKSVKLKACYGKDRRVELTLG